jgi:hypothetical protein
MRFFRDSRTVRHLPIEVEPAVPHKSADSAVKRRRPLRTPPVDGDRLTQNRLEVGLLVFAWLDGVHDLLPRSRAPRERAAAVQSAAQSKQVDQQRGEALRPASGECRHEAVIE